MATKSTTEVDKQVGARVRARREAIKVSQEKLGDALGITFQQIQKYEKGTNRIGSSRLAQIAKALDVPVSYFFDGLDGSAGTSDVLSDPEIVELISAFRAIESKDLRRSLVGIARIMSGTAGGADARGKVKAST